MNQLAYDQFEIPIALIIFNRPNTTRRVFQAIRDIKPKHLFIIADGPRPYRPKDIELVEKTREIVRHIDWPCDVRYDIAPQNMGCKKRVWSGLTNAFKDVEKLIVLEDDCLPSSSCFNFFKEMLDAYEADERIGMIAGTNFVPSESLTTPGDFRFSIYGHIWGWATWRRAWKNYDVNISKWEEIRHTDFLTLYGGKIFEVYWRRIFEDVFHNKIDTWDYQWQFSLWLNRQLSISPNKNLVLNIGYGPDATHTWGRIPKWLPSKTEDLPIIIRSDIPPYPDPKADKWTSRNIFTNTTTLKGWTRICIALTVHHITKIFPSLHEAFRICARAQIAPFNKK